MTVSFCQTDLYELVLTRSDRIGEPDPTHGQFFNFLFVPASESFRLLRNENETTLSTKNQDSLKNDLRSFMVDPQVGIRTGNSVTLRSHGVRQ